MNYSDSERISSFLEARNFQPTKNLTQSDIVIFNTCGVRQMAEDRVYGQIHNLRKNDSNLKIILTGCLANRPDIQARLKNKVDLFTSIQDFPQKIEKMLILNYPPIFKDSSSKTSKLIKNYFHIKPRYKNKFISYIPIMTGCNNFCAYCVVPYARGREFSRPVDEIISEIKTLIKTGTKHIILLGQNVNSYDSKISPKQKINFPKLLKKIDAIPGKFWISFISNHPKDVTDEMIEMVAKCKKVCENFHLPLQAGNDEVLKNMNRKYTAKEYIRIVQKIKSTFKKYKPDIPFALTSDIIVGFPGETRKQFADSAEIMRKAKFDMVFFGQFSPRPGTVAWEFPDKTAKSEKVRREKYLNDILKKTTYANNKNYVDKVIDILVEKEKAGFYYGKTRTAKNVKLPIGKNKHLIGKFVKIKIIKANIWNLEGKNIS